ncbi:MAG: DUF3299 domain-containing protein [Candidatus Thiodiazotropha sp.]|jgi:uncharacterized protein
MRKWLFLSLAIVGAMTLNGCDQLDDKKVPSAPVLQAEIPQTPGDKKVAHSEILDKTGESDVREINWDTLIPDDWRPETLMEQYNANELSDDDPRAQQLLEKLKALWSQAPIVPALEGERVKLPGFVVPLEMDTKKMAQFLLVPYYGACIHVPPPPANQTVHVLTREGTAFNGRLFDTVWVTGTMRVEHLSSELAEAGYRLEDASVTPYNE